MDVLGLTCGRTFEETSSWLAYRASLLLFHDVREVVVHLFGPSWGLAGRVFNRTDDKLDDI